MPDMKKLVGLKEYSQELYFPTWKIPEEHPIVQSGITAYKELYDEAPVVDKWTFLQTVLQQQVAIRFQQLVLVLVMKIKLTHLTKLHVKDLGICAAFYAMLPYHLQE